MVRPHSVVEICVAEQCSVTCRIRHMKCDEARPECQNCIKKGKTCRYEPGQSSPEPLSASIEAGSQVVNSEITDFGDDHSNIDHFGNAGVSLESDDGGNGPDIAVLRNEQPRLRNNFADHHSTSTKPCTRCDELYQS